MARTPTYTQDVILGRRGIVAAIFGLLASLAVFVAPAQAVMFLPPENLRGVVSTPTRFQVAWNAVSGAPGYRVHYSTNSNFSPTSAISATGTSVVLPNLQPTATYYVRVAVLDGTTLQSEWSSTLVKKPFSGISVGTYNIKDPDADPPWNPWDTRRAQSASAIIGQGVRLLGVQEVFEDNDREDMLESINRAAGGSYYSMVPNADSGVGEDSRVVFDQRVFRHLASGGLTYVYQNGSEERAFAWAKLQHRASFRYVLFLTTHLSPRSDAADVYQWRQLIRFVKQTAAASSAPLSVIITGDFNTTKFEPPAIMLAESRSAGYEDVLGQIRESYSTYRNPSTRVDAWISTSNRGLRDVRQYSVATNRNANSIDYIFVSKALKAKYFRVYAQPRTGYIMNYLMSDHFLVRATLSD